MLRLVGAFGLLAGVASGEFYLGVYMGGAQTRAATVGMQRNTGEDRLLFDRVAFDGRSLESPIYYGYRAGYFFTRRFGIEAEFIHLKVYANLDRPVQIEGMLDGTVIDEQAPMRNYFDQFEVSHGLNMALVNGVFRQPLLGRGEPQRRRLLFVGRAGAGPTIPHPEVSAFGEAVGAYEIGPAAVHGAAGVEARFWRGVHLLGEYKYTFTPTSFSIPDGRAKFRAHSHHLAVGFAVHF